MTSKLQQERKTDILGGFISKTARSVSCCKSLISSCLLTYIRLLIVLRFFLFPAIPKGLACAFQGSRIALSPCQACMGNAASKLACLSKLADITFCLLFPLHFLRGGPHVLPFLSSEVLGPIIMLKIQGDYSVMFASNPVPKMSIITVTTS